ncbi:hypothetical protein BN946_scf184999.g32 [Trametes cinnabarina]|uniref:Amino acid permease/ SLC12A domain-containing protein n=1 Tax=Pycnoporus cinnabarinus TaxID=5643 RepID=A0A060S7D6_PYCCI|nr:hypothetical protein BN946_scf184999.g32 [Trametes cinnabarina]
MSMAELASAAPTSGGLYFWTHSLSSPRWRNLLAWIVGYANTIGSVASVASIDWGCAVQITAAASIGSGQTYSATNAQTFGVYTAVVLSHAVICCLGTRLLARLQTVYVILNVLLCLAVIIALPAATPKEFRNSASYALGNFTNTSGWPDGYAFILSFLAPLWTICSFDSSVHISEEASNAATAVPWAIVYAIGIAGVLGWAINVALAFCMGTDLDSLMDSPVGQPMAQIFFNSFGQKGTLALWSIVVLVHFTRTPVNTVWFVAVFSILLGLLAFAGDSAINAIFAMSITALYIARFLGDNDFRPGPFNLGMWSAPVGAIAVLWMLFMGIVFLFPTSPNPAVPDMNYTVVVLGGVMIFSLIWYYFPKYGGVHWFQGPVPTIVKTEPEEQESGRSSTTDSMEKEKAAVSVIQREA